MAITGGGGSGPRRVRNIAELARIAGVSAGTVSRALAGKTLVNVETRDRIQSLAREYGFRPNQMASKLRTQRTGVIGVVIPPGEHIFDPFFMTMLGHIADGLADHGYDLMLSRVIPDQDDWLERIVDSGMVDGVLLIGQSSQIETIERVAAHYRPLVVWGEWREGQRHCTVGSDNRAGGVLAAQRLIDTGRRHLVFMGDIAPPAIAARFRGANQVAQAAGLDSVEPLAVHFGSGNVERDLAAHVARLKGAIDGVICGSDRIAMTALRVLADAGMAVPGRIAVIGFDDLPLAALTVPRLTTVRQDIAGGARAMIEALVARLGGSDAPSVVMPPELVVRESA